MRPEFIYIDECRRMNDDDWMYLLHRLGYWRMYSVDKDELLLCEL